MIFFGQICGSLVSETGLFDLHGLSLLLEENWENENGTADVIRPTLYMGL